MSEGPKCILLADDDIEDHDLLENFLRTLDATKSVTGLFNGGEVLDYLSGCPDDSLPCLIILDFKMPIMNADEVLKSLRALPRYKDIPKVVWSTSNQSQHIDTCIKNGAAAYFTKPGTLDELESIARQMLSLVNV
jgi:CheY-like chemotaxis protein